MARSASHIDDGEILDGMITRGRGEIRRTCSSKVNSSTTTPCRDFKGLQSPRVSLSLSEKVYSPRVNELREQSPRVSVKSTSSPLAGPSNLGKTN